jgi:hypothetical protein
MSQVQGAGGRCVPPWPKDALRISFRVIWLIDAILKWLPGFRSGYMDTIMGQADGQPGRLGQAAARLLAHRRIPL